MKYQAEYDYLERVLGKMRLRVMLLTRNWEPDQYLDFGLRKFLGVGDRYHRILQSSESWAAENTIYRITDEFDCNYVFLLLPETGDGMLVGPYLTLEKTREQLMEEAERYGLPASRLHDLEACYAAIPLLRDDSTFFAMMNVFGETIWGGSHTFTMLEVRDDPPAGRLWQEEEADRDPAEVMLRMKSMEDRYTYENEWMQLVTLGQSQRAERMLGNFSKLSLELRTSDPLRNVKNYCIVCNTLLRKAAERGGVHPLHLDVTSSDMARRVEQITDPEEGGELMRTMVRAYCRLVRKSALRRYSAPVRQAIACMESDLTVNLSLSALAELLNVNASYLSDLFHRETGKTITEYVTELRLNQAANLLSTTNLQIQTVAQHCGISDVNYFSKLFKKQYLVTPRQYRTEHNPYR